MRLGLGISLVHQRRHGAGSAPTAPTLAPVLSVFADPESTVAELSWTASNKTTSPGFGYKIERADEGLSFAQIATTTATTYDDDSPGSGTFYYRVTPFNSAGEGPVSNEANVLLPGESEPGPYLLLNGGGWLLLNSGGGLLING